MEKSHRKKHNFTHKVYLDSIWSNDESSIFQYLFIGHELLLFLMYSMYSASKYFISQSVSNAFAESKFWNFSLFSCLDPLELSVRYIHAYMNADRQTSRVHMNSAFFRTIFFLFPAGYFPCWSFFGVTWHIIINSVRFWVKMYFFRIHKKIK